MDSVERGLPSSDNKSPPKLYVVTLFATLAIAFLALTVATLAYMQLGGKPHGEINSINRPQRELLGLDDTEIEKKAMQMVAAMLVEHDEQHSRNQRAFSNHNPDETCTSSINLTRTPSAHIIHAAGPEPCTIPTPDTGVNLLVLSQNWTCNQGKVLRRAGGFVHGGMSFDRLTGFLKLPVDGFYFIYSQVAFWAKEISENQSIQIGHKTIVCEPSPFPGFQCGSSNFAYMESLSKPYIGDGETLTPHFHGGIFHFKAGTQIAVIGWYDQHIRDDGILQIAAHWSHSFMGAFLIEQISYAELE